MKTLMTHFLTLCLIQMQLMIPVAMADGAGSGSGTSATDTVYASQGGNLDNGQVGGHGVIKPNQETKGDEKGGMALQQIALFGAAIAAPQILMYCSAKYDAWIFTASAALYLVAEIAAAREYKEQSEREMAYYRDKDHDEQIEGLQTAADITAEAAETAKKKASYATIAASGFALAAIVAAIDAASETFTGGGACAVDYTQPKNPEPMAAPQSYAMTAGSLESLKLAKNDAQALANYQEIEFFKSGRSHSLTLDEYSSIKEKFASGAHELKDLLVTVASLASEIIIPKAQAKGQAESKTDNTGTGVTIAGVIFASWAVGALGAEQALFNGEYLTGKSSGWIRAATYGVVSLLSFSAASEMDEEGDKLSKRAAQYRELASTARHKLEQLDRYAVNYNEQALKKNAALNKRENQGDGNKDACFKGGRGAAVVVDANCECKKNNSCKKAEIPKVDFAQFGNGSLLSSTSNLLGQSANSLYSGNTAGANVAGVTAGQNAIKIRNLKKKVIADYNKKRIKSGKKAFDFDRLERRQAKRLKTQAQKILNGLNSDQRRALAYMEAPAPIIKEKGAKKAAVKVAMKSGKSLNKGAAKKDPFAGLDFEFEDSDAQADMDQLAEASKEGAAADIDQYEVDSDDINEQRNANIFKLITTRYMQSAYPVLFEVKKLE